MAGVKLGEERRKEGLRCLAVARYMAAAVVAVLAGMTLLTVLTTGLRPEPMGLVTQGHILAAQDMWNRNSNYLLPHYRAGRNRSLTVYDAANHLDFWISMNIGVSGGGGNLDRAACTITTVSVFDMPNAPYLEGMVKIATMQMDHGGIEICQEHAGVLDRWITVDNRLTLEYIARTYGGVNDFTTMLQVNMTIAHNDTGVPMPRNHTYYCWPVTIGHSRSTTAEDVTCKSARQIIDYAAASVSLAPPPPTALPSPPPAPAMDNCCGSIEDSEAASSDANTCCCFYLPLLLFILICSFFLI